MIFHTHTLNYINKRGKKSYANRESIYKRFTRIYRDFERAIAFSGRRLYTYIYLCLVYIYIDEKASQQLLSVLCGDGGGLAVSLPIVARLATSSFAVAALKYIAQ